MTPAERYRRALPPGDVEQFPTTPLDRVGVPAWTVALLGDDRRPAFGGLGYGTTDDEALTGAYGEITEESRSWLALAGRDRRQASYVELTRERGADRVQDPRTLDLPAGAAYDPDRPLQWLAMTRLRDGAEVLVPAEYVASSPADLGGPPPPGGWLTVPVTNGLGAGFDRDRAVAHGLLEVLQRDGNGLAIRALDRGVVLDLDGVRDPDTRAVLDRLRVAGVQVLVKLAATDFGVANLCVVGAAPDDDVLAATAAGEAAHPDRERALRKAVLEFAAARARKRFMHGPLDAVAAVAPAGYLDRTLPGVDPAKDEPRVLDAMVEWLRLRPEEWRPRLEATVLSHRTTVAFADLPTSGDLPSGPLLELLLGRLGAEGFDVLVADLAGDDVSAVKVVVPGLEVETMAYGRLGERNVRRLLDAGRDDLVHVGAAPPAGRAARVHLTPDAEERLGGSVWLDRAALDRAVDGLYPLYREPGRHAAQLALTRVG